MFCTQCGTKNSEGAVFCSSCGKGMAGEKQVPIQTLGEPSPKRKNRTLILSLAGVGFIAVIALVLSMTVFRPAPTLDNVDKYMVTAADLSDFQVEESSDATDWTDGTRIFSTDCSPQAKFETTVKRATSWAKAGFVTSGSDQTYIDVSEQILGFPTEESAVAFMDAIKAATNDSSCTPDTPNPQFADISSFFGENLDGVYMKLDYTSGDSIYGLSFARRGKVVAIISNYAGDDSSDLYTNDVSIGQLEEVVKVLLHRFNN